MFKTIGRVLAFLCGLVIAAHFLRQGLTPLVLAGVAFPFLLLLRKRWADRTVQVLLLLAAAVWVSSLAEIAARRLATGESWIRMAVILGSVALVNVVSALALGVKGRSRESS
jgi:hypothetical protein